jgi:5-methylcytosine-specific restriction endonuclease McrA
MTGRKGRIPDPLRERISREAGYRCGYCLCPQELLGMPMSIEHILPEAAGGTMDPENLWLACRRCNEFKGTHTTGRDPESGADVRCSIRAATSGTSIFAGARMAR